MTMVSAIMPTRGRREYAALTVRDFLAQTWPEKELLILDDPDKPSFETSPESLSPSIKYMMADKKRTIADKRNILCKAASASIIVHFDSDDWSAPTRMERQMELFMEDRKKSVCGFRRMYFWQVAANQAWVYNGTPDYVLGTSLMFRRSWWAHNQWDTRFKIGSDNVFVNTAWRAHQLTVITPVTDQMVSRNHADNTNSRRYGTRWKKVDRTELPQAFFADMVN